MLSLQGVLNLLNDGAFKRDRMLTVCDDVYYNTSLHIDGITPAYKDLRYEMMVYPTIYNVNYQTIFETKLFSKYPNESEETRSYRLSQYKPVQKEAFLKAIQVIVGAIFQDSQYTIEVERKEDNDYIWGENFEGKHLIAYLVDKFTDICNDPNGRFVLIPKYSSAETIGKVEPILWFIPSVDIKLITQDEFIFYKGGYVWMVNKFGYFRYEKKDDGKYHIIEPDGYYAHLLNRLPVYLAGGLRNGQGYYNSWLDAAVIIANEFVGEKSLAMLVNKQTAHPYFVAASEDCPNCEGGKVQICKKCRCDSSDCQHSEEHQYDWTPSNCTNCGGKGVLPQDPSKCMIVPPDQMANDQIKVVTIDPNISKVQGENVKDVEDRILRALHLNYIDEQQSGVAKGKDMETRYQFISMISNYCFDDLVYNWIKDICALRNIRVADGVAMPDDNVSFLIVKPTQFAIETALELREDYKGSYEARMPDYILSRQLLSYVDKKFGGDVIYIRKVSLINDMDKIAVTPPERVSMLLLNGGIKRRDLQFHTELPLILDQLERDKTAKWLLESDFQLIKNEVDKIFTTIAQTDVLDIGED